MPIAVQLSPTVQVRRLRELHPEMSIEEIAERSGLEPYAVRDALARKEVKRRKGRVPNLGQAQ